MEKRAMLCFLVFCLVATGDGATLDDITDLQDKSFGKTFPRHGLFLLHWFSNNIEIDQNNVIRANFDPIRGDYGSHYYGNRDQRRAFPEIDRNTGRAYYSIGNINVRDIRSQFPHYVTDDFSDSQGNSNRNRDRIVIQIQRNNSRVVESLYVTEHYANMNQGSGYDPDNTFQINTRLLRQIQDLNTDNGYYNVLAGAFRPEGFQQRLQTLQNIHNNPGLARCLALAGYDSSSSAQIFSNNYSCTISNMHGRYVRHSTDAEVSCKEYSEIKLEVKSTADGKAKVVWSGLPKDFVKPDLHVGLDYGEGASYNPDNIMSLTPLNGRTHGSIDSSVPLNPGLRVRLVTVEYTGFFYKSRDIKKDYGNGPEFDEANRVLPTEIPGHEASFQLFVKDGYACARLYIKKSFTEWTDAFYKSWVGFYSSSQDDNSNYNTYQWCINFQKRSNQDDSGDYDIYEYESSLAIGPGLQIRFMDHGGDKARTAPWEGDINPKSKFTSDELR